MGSRDSLTSAPSELWRLAVVCAARGACQPIPNSQGHIHFIVIVRVSAHIQLSLRINISLIIGEIYKMVEDFSIQFSSFYLPMKYLAIISRHPVYKDYAFRGFPPYSDPFLECQCFINFVVHFIRARSSLIP